MNGTNITKEVNQYLFKILFKSRFTQVINALTLIELESMTAMMSVSLFIIILINKEGSTESNVSTSFDCSSLTTGVMSGSTSSTTGSTNTTYVIFVIYEIIFLILFRMNTAIPVVVSIRIHHRFIKKEFALLMKMCAINKVPFMLYLLSIQMEQVHST